MEKYTVTRQHYGDQQYFEGDQRELNAQDAKTLMAAGLVSDGKVEDTEKKAAPATKNKMKADVQNKSE